MESDTRTLALRPQQKRPTCSSASSASLPPPDEPILLARRGNVSIYANNEFSVSAEDFILLAALERLANDGERSNWTAREISQEVCGVYSRGISLKLRQLVKDGHLESTPSNKGLVFALVRSLDDYYPLQYVSIPFCRESLGRRLQIVRTLGGDLSFSIEGPLGDEWYKTSVKDFQRGACSIAHLVLTGRESGFELIKAGNAPSGAKQLLVMFPYRFRKGLRRKSAVGMKFVLQERVTTVSWRGAESEVPFLDGAVRPQDLLNASELLQDRRATECMRRDVS